MINFKVNSCDGIYSNSLDVRFTKTCDNNCSFCIEKKGINSLGYTNVNKMIQATLDSGKKDILILGGEPLLLAKEVLEYIKGIRNYVDKIYITTSLPINIKTYDIIEFEQIIKLVDGINVSVHHYADSVNNSVLKSMRPYNRIKFLKFMLGKNPEFKEKLRLCCNLAAPYMDTEFDIDKYVHQMYHIGVRHIKFNELQNVDADTYVSFEKIYDVKMKSPFAYGCQTDISYLFSELKDLKVTLKRSCFCVKDPKISKACFADLIKCIAKRFNKNLNSTDFKVLYENGDLKDSWLQQKL